MPEANLPLFLQGQVGTPIKTPAEDVRAALGGLFTPGAININQRRGGILPGAAGMQGATTIVGSDIRVDPFSAVIPGTSSAVQGSYPAVLRTQRLITPAPAGSGLFRKGIIVARVYDSLYDSSGQNLWDVYKVEGGTASTLASAPEPTMPPNAILIRSYSVANAVISFRSGSGTYPQQTAANGGIALSNNADDYAGSHIGQYRDTQDGYGLQRWNGSEWKSVSGATYGVTPNSTTIDPGQTYGITVAGGKAPFIGCRGLLIVSTQVRFLNGAAQQTFTVNGHGTASVGITYGQTDFETSERVPGAPSSGEVITRLYRHLEIIPTSLTWSAAVTYTVGTGGTSVQIANPRTIVLWLPYV